MEELLPVVSGMLLGLMCGLARPQMRLVLATTGSAFAGLGATVISGEFRLGWEFLLIDIPLVVVSSAATFAAMRRAGETISTARSDTTPG